MSFFQAQYLEENEDSNEGENQEEFLAANANENPEESDEQEDYQPGQNPLTDQERQSEKEQEEDRKHKEERQQQNHDKQLARLSKGKVGRYFADKKDAREAKKNRKAVKKIKKEVGKQDKKDPYHRNMLSKKFTNFMSEREPLIVNPMKHRFDQIVAKRKRQAQAVKDVDSDDVEWAEKKKKKYEESKKEEKVAAGGLQAALGAAGVKMGLEDAAGIGCFKDMKGCLTSSTKMLCFTIVGGAIISAILKLCGLF